jgi:hypothetical protein
MTKDLGVRFQVSGVSAASGLKNGKSNGKRNSSPTNVECRLTNVELRNSVYFKKD